MVLNAFSNMSHVCATNQVFFFIDPEFLNDPAMDNVHEITLSYTFFKTGEEDAIQVEDEEGSDKGEDKGSSPAAKPAIAASA